MRKRTFSGFLRRVSGFLSHKLWKVAQRCSGKAFGTALIKGSALLGNSFRLAQQNEAQHISVLSIGAN